MQQQSCHGTRLNWTSGWSPRCAEEDVGSLVHLQCIQSYGDPVQSGEPVRDRWEDRKFPWLLDRSKKLWTIRHIFPSSFPMPSLLLHQRLWTKVEDTTLPLYWWLKRPMLGSCQRAKEWVSTHLVFCCLTWVALSAPWWLECWHGSMHGVSGRSLNDDEQGVQNRVCKRVHGCPLCQQVSHKHIHGVHRSCSRTWGQLTHLYIYKLNINNI